MKIVVGTDIIKKIDLIKDNGIFLKMMFKGNDEDVLIEILNIDFIAKLLELLKFNSLGKVKNVPIRLILTDSEEEDDMLELIAIGDIIEDRWLACDSIFEAPEIIEFEKLFEVDEQTDIELEVAI